MLGLSDSGWMVPRLSVSGSFTLQTAVAEPDLTAL
jgi:hypothetical protein